MTIAARCCPLKRLRYPFARLPKRCVSSKTSSDDKTDSSTSSSNNDIRSSLTFPWRHSPTTLPRVVDRDDLSGMPNNTRARFVRSCLAAKELDVSWIQLFLTQSWKTTLAEDFGWAFQKGVEGLLSRIFHVPMDEIDLDDDGIGIDCRGENISSKEWTEEQAKDAQEYVDGMLEENLRNLYNDIDPTSINFVLKMKPIECRFESAFVVPMVSRESVRKNPSLKGAYQRIEEEFTKTGSVSKVQEMGQMLAKETGYSGMRTIIADVSVDCLETFQVRDASSDKVLQGPKDAMVNKVTHLVRFEIVRKRNEDPEKQLGSWQIVDWDDLLEGNVWH